MQLSSLVRNIVFNASYFTGINQFLISRQIKSRNHKTILNYHHILEEGEFDPELLVNGYAHSTKSFREQLKFISTNYPTSTDLTDPTSLTITFDDGALNNYTIASEIMNEFGIKAIFYVNDRHHRPEGELWIDFWYAWFSYAPSGDYTLLDTPFQLNDGNRREVEPEQFYKIIQRQRVLSQSMEELRRQFDPTPFMKKNPNRYEPMHLDHIKELLTQGHSIGYHTKSHCWLSELDKGDLLEEIKIPRRLVEVISEKNSISIPFGFPESYTEDTLNTILGESYDRVLLNHARQGSKSILGRINLPNSSDPAHFSSHLAGWPAKLRSAL